MKFRTGRKLGRTLYLVDEQSDDRDADTLIGLVDTERWADLIVRALNERYADEDGE